LLAVLTQYTPVRLCALERAAFGASCHDQEAAGIVQTHGDELTCGSDGGGGQRCICEQPKVVADQQPAPRIPVAVAGCTVVTSVVQVSSPSMTVRPPASDPQRDLLASLQLPLLL
jgi:hypothetical protein